MVQVLEGSVYINGSPQNTFVPGLLELAEQVTSRYVVTSQHAHTSVHASISPSSAT